MDCTSEIWSDRKTSLFYVSCMMVCKQELEQEGLHLTLSRQVKQGCVLALALFNLFLAAISPITHNIIGRYKGVEIEYRLDGNVFNLRRLQAHTKTSNRHIIELQYAGDLVLQTNSPTDLQDRLDILISAYISICSHGSKSNINKSEVLIQHASIEPIQPQFHIEGEVLMVVENLTYLSRT